MIKLTLTDYNFEIEIDEDIELTKENNFETYTEEGLYSKSLTIKLDNCQPLQALHNFNSVNVVDSLINAKLQINNTIMIGVLLIQSINYDGVIAKELNVTFNQLTNFFNAIKNKNCQEIDTKYYDSWYNADDVLWSMYNRTRLNEHNKAYTYTLAKFDNRTIAPTPSFNTFYTNDFIPIAKTKYIIENIINNAGYGVKYNFNTQTKYLFDRHVVDATNTINADLTTFYDGVVQQINLPYVKHGANFVNNNSFKVGLTASKSLVLSSTTSTTNRYNNTISFTSTGGNSVTEFRNTIGKVWVNNNLYDTLRYDDANSCIKSGFDVVNQKLKIYIDAYLPRFTNGSAVYSTDLTNSKVVVKRTKNGVTKNTNYLFSTSNLRFENGNYFSYSSTNLNTDWWITGVIEHPLNYQYNYNTDWTNPLTHNYNVSEEKIEILFDIEIDKSNLSGNAEPAPRINEATFMYNEVTNEYREGTVINVAEDLLPNMQQNEFLKNIINLLNIKLTVDEVNKIVTLHSFDEFYKTENSLDISEYFNMNNVVIEYLPTTTPTNFIFNPKTVETELNKLYKLKFGNNFGYTTFTINKLNPTNTALTIDSNIGYTSYDVVDSNRNFIVPSLKAETEKINMGLIANSEYNQLAYYNVFNNYHFAIDTYNIWDTYYNATANATGNFDGYYPSYLLHSNVINASYSLLFNADYYLTYNNPASNNCLYLNTLHQNKIFELSNNNARKIKLDFRCDDSVANMLLNNTYNTVYIKQLNSKFYVNSVTYNTNGNILLDLIKKSN